VAAISHRIVLPLFVAFGARRTSLFARTPFVARADPGPRSEMSSTREAAHIRTDLSDDGRSSDRSSRRQREEEFHRFFLLGNESGNIDLHPLDRPIQVVEVVEQFAKEQLVVRLYSSIQRQTQRGQLFAQASFSQLGQDLRVRLPLLDGLEHTSPTDSDHIPGYRSQFHVSCFQHLVDAIDLLGAQLDKLLTISRQISQDPDRWWRNKAWTQQPVAQEVC